MILFFYVIQIINLQGNFYINIMQVRDNLKLRLYSFFMNSVNIFVFQKKFVFILIFLVYKKIYVFEGGWMVVVIVYNINRVLFNVVEKKINL